MKSLKKQKEVEKVKPPWRVSAAPPKTIDKNAIKNKILDASRRAIRAAKNINIGTQTEPISVKLMREAAIEVQNDLIIMRDEECLTDGTITIKDSLGNLILTHSVSQMTDDVILVESGTQTALPRSNISFTKYIHNNNNINNNNNESTSSINANNTINFDAISRNESCLLKQINEIMKIDEKLKLKSYDFLNSNDIEKNNNDDKEQDDNDDIDADSINLSETETKNINYASSNYPINSFQKPDLLTAINGTGIRTKINGPTRANWQDIDFSDDDGELPKLPRRVLGEGNKPWCDFKDLLIGQRLANMRLSPIQARRSRPNLKHVTWGDTEHRAVTDLITEANALIGIFDKVSMLLGPDLKLNDITHIESTELPPFTLDPILTRSCNVLEEKLKKLRPIEFKDIEKLRPELLQYLQVNEK